MEDDQFSLSDNEEHQQGARQAPAKSMKTVYQQLEQGLKKEQKSKKIKKGKQQAKTAKVAEDDEQAQGRGTEGKRKGDPHCKYIRNKALQTKLRDTALSGVLRIMNMISKTQLQRQVE